MWHSFSFGIVDKTDDQKRLINTPSQFNMAKFMEFSYRNMGNSGT